MLTNNYLSNYYFIFIMYRMEFSCLYVNEFLLVLAFTEFFFVFSTKDAPSVL